MTKGSPTQQTNALLAAVVASSMDAVFSIDTSARIQTWNSAAEQLYGYTAAEAIGQFLGLLAPIPRTMRQGLGSNAYFKASRFISKRSVDAKMEVWSRLGSVLGQFGTRVDTWLVCPSSIATYPNASAPSGTCARCTNGSRWHKKQGM